MKLNFNTEENLKLGKDGKYELLPPGDYAFRILDAEVDMKDSASFLKLTLEVFEGSKKGRKIWPKFTLEHSNEKARNVGRSLLANLCVALKIDQLRDTSQLLGKKFMATVAHSEPKGADGKVYLQLRDYSPVPSSMVTETDAVIESVAEVFAGAEFV